MSELDQAYAQLERIAKSHLEKSVGGQTPKSAKAARAVAIAKATSTPEGARLARRILQLESQQIVRAQYGDILKNAGIKAEDAEEDEWLSNFEKVDEDELLQKLRELREEEADVIQQIRAAREA